MISSPSKGHKLTAIGASLHIGILPVSVVFLPRDVCCASGIGIEWAMHPCRDIAVDVASSRANPQARACVCASCRGGQSISC